MSFSPSFLCVRCRYLSGSACALAILGTFFAVDAADSAVSVCAASGCGGRGDFGVGCAIHGAAVFTTFSGLCMLSYSWVCVGIYMFGTFLAIFASAGLIPGVLEPGRISLLLSKPMGRTTLLLGRYLGNLLIVVLNTIYMVTGVWLIFAYKTNIWDYRFLMAIPLMIFIFAVLLCVVVFVGVISESAALSVWFRWR